LPISVSAGCSVLIVVCFHQLATRLSPKWRKTRRSPLLRSKECPCRSIA
jgi:hypothetical protein